MEEYLKRCVIPVDCLLDESNVLTELGRVIGRDLDTVTGVFECGRVGARCDGACESRLTGKYELQECETNKCAGCVSHDVEAD
jgi:hypothetical protein